VARITFDFGLSNVGRTWVMTLETHTHYFLKGYCWAPNTKTVPAPRANEVVVFDDLFSAGLHILPHPVLVEILPKFRVQLHQLTRNVIVQIGKFISAISSCGGRPTVNVFARHYKLHYQQKKIRLGRSDNTLRVQFGCITFHPSRYGGRAMLTPAVKNKWSNG
jgi:hypothetical protein